MITEHYRVRLDGKRIVIAVVSDETLKRIEPELLRAGCSSVGPAAWQCDMDLPVERLASAVGELAEDEVIYIAADGKVRTEFGFLVAAKTEGGIIVSHKP